MYLSLDWLKSTMSIYIITCYCTTLHIMYVGVHIIFRFLLRIHLSLQHVMQSIWYFRLTKCLTSHSETTKMLLQHVSSNTKICPIACSKATAYTHKHTYRHVNRKILKHSHKLFNNQFSPTTQTWLWLWQRHSEDTVIFVLSSR